MSKRLFSCISLLFVVANLAVLSAAQGTQRFETFGGYSFSYNSNLLPTATNFSGWDTSSTIYLNRWFGMTADFSGHYGSELLPIAIVDGQTIGKVNASVGSYTYLFGPHVRYHHSRYAPFAESLFGVHNPHTTFTVVESAECPPPSSCYGPGVGSSSSSSYHKFAMAVGGGLDIALSHGISLRPVEVDYLLLREPYVAVENGNLVNLSANYNTFRYSAGVTFRFGSHLGPPR